MIRGTVQTFKFTTSCKNTEIEWIKIYFDQPNNPSDKLPIIKGLADCGPRDSSNQLDGSNTLYVSLTAYDTARFSDKYKAKMYVLMKQVNGVEFGNEEYLIPVYPMPDDVIEATPPSGDTPPVIPPAGQNGWIVLDGANVI